MDAEWGDEAVRVNDLCAKMQKILKNFVSEIKTTAQQSRLSSLCRTTARVIPARSNFEMHGIL